MAFAENGAMSPADVAAVMGNGNANGFGWGGDGAWWLIILFLFMFNGNWGNGGYGGGDVQRGFDQSAVMSGLSGVQSAITSGFGDTALGISGINQAIAQNANATQVAMLQGFNNMQSQFANCCCENRLGIANLGSDIAREACADRAAVTDALYNVTNQMNAGFQSIRDQMSQDKIDAKNEEIANLRTQLNMQNLAASQSIQTAQLIADNTAQTQYIVNRVAPYPIPAYTVPNPFGTATTATTAG